MNQQSHSPGPEPERLQLDLSRAPAVLFLYGLAGAGKNYVGDVIGERSGRFVYHADQDFTPEMKEAIEARRTFTPEMRDRYISIVAERIKELKVEHGELVVTQATYKQEHRDFLLSQIEDMEVLCISAPTSLIEERLGRRGDAITPEYAARMQANFEQPSPYEKVILNDADPERIVSQLNVFYGKQSSGWYEFSF